MTKSAVKPEPELFAPLKQGPDKGGKNPPKSQVKERPAPPTPSNPPSGGTSGKHGPAKRHEVVVHQAQPKSLMQVISEAASNPQIDVQKMRELLDLKREIEREEKEQAFNMAIAAVKAELPPIVADSKNTHTKSWWARYERVSKVVDPIIRKHQLVLSFGMSESPIADHYRVICDVSHIPSGFTKRYFLDGPSDAAGAKGGGSKTPIQGVASTISYLQRILKGLIFDVVIEKVDRDGNAPEGETVTEEQADELLRLCAEKGITRDTFQTAFRVNDIYALPARKFEEAKAKLAMAPKREPKSQADARPSDE